MGGLREHFNAAASGYAIHRATLRAERLPACCRTGLSDSGCFIQSLGAGGEEALYPLLQCAVCGRYFALCGEKYLPVENLMRYEVIRR